MAAPDDSDDRARGDPPTSLVRVSTQEWEAEEVRPVRRRIYFRRRDLDHTDIEATKGTLHAFLFKVARAAGKYVAGTVGSVVTAALIAVLVPWLTGFFIWFKQTIVVLIRDR